MDIKEYYQKNLSEESEIPPTYEYKFPEELIC